MPEPTNLEKAVAAAAKQHADVKARMKGGAVVYSAKGVDLFSRSPATPHCYTLLQDDANGNAAGRVMQLTGPDYDHAAACTARDMADAL